MYSYRTSLQTLLFSCWFVTLTHAATNHPLTASKPDSNATSAAVFSGPIKSVLADSATLVLLTPSTVCAGSTADFAVNISGGGTPYTINYSINGVPQSPVVTFLNPYTFSIPVSDTTTVELTGVNAGGIPILANGTITINAATPPTAEISGGGQICQNGSGTDIIFTFTGQGPYSFIYTADNVLQPPITTSSNPYVLPVSPSSGTIYQLIAVSNGICTGTVSGIAIVFVFTPSTAMLFVIQAILLLLWTLRGPGHLNWFMPLTGWPSHYCKHLKIRFLFLSVQTQLRCIPWSVFIRRAAPVR